jgi:hypothetical protein
MSKYGFTESVWNAAKAEMRATLVRTAKARDFIPYSELVSEIHSIPFDPRDPKLFYMLREISSEEDVAGRGMLTAVVTHKRGDMIPGQGFFDLAKSLGHNPKDEVKFWLQQIKKVHDYWSAMP